MRGFERSNNRLHTNAAIALRFHVEHHWRGVGEPSRSTKAVASIGTRR
jgi:hypothetical protein